VVLYLKSVSTLILRSPPCPPLLLLDGALSGNAGTTAEKVEESRRNTKEGGVGVRTIDRGM
jgi:hypothetical protein